MQYIQELRICRLYNSSQQYLKQLYLAILSIWNSWGNCTCWIFSPNVCLSPTWGIECDSNTALAHFEEKNKSQWVKVVNSSSFYSSKIIEKSFICEIRNMLKLELELDSLCVLWNLSWLHLGRDPKLHIFWHLRLYYTLALCGTIGSTLTQREECLILNH